MNLRIGDQVYVRLKLIGDHEVSDYRGIIIDKNFDVESNNYVITLQLSPNRVISFLTDEIYYYEVHPSDLLKRRRVDDYRTIDDDYRTIDDDCLIDDCCTLSIKRLKIHE